jgi:DNA repair exonuclease SbcCD ATPase subunit
MNADDQLRDLQKRVETLEKVVLPGPRMDPSGQREIPSEVEQQLQQLQQLNEQLAALTARQARTDQYIDRLVTMEGELQRLRSEVEQLQAETAGLRVLRRGVREAKDAGLRVLRWGVREVRARVRARGHDRTRAE